MSTLSQIQKQCYWTYEIKYVSGRVWNTPVLLSATAGTLCVLVMNAELELLVAL